MLTSIKGIGEKTKLKLNSLGIFTPNDLIHSFPKKYIDLSLVCDISHADNGDYCITEFVIKKIMPPYKRGRLQMLKVNGIACGKDISVVWFNQNYLGKSLQEDQSYVLYGKLIIDADGKYSLINPAHEKKGMINSSFIGIQPVYKTRGILSQKTYKEFVDKALINNVQTSFLIDEKTEKQYNLMPYNDAIISLHKPQSFCKIEQAKKRIQTEILVKRIAALKIEKINEKRNYDFKNKSVHLFDEIIEKLAYQLTKSQNIALQTIIKKLVSDNRMNVLLCGDVGSGKTIVAFLACYFVIKNGYQAAIMAPTEILASQHFSRAKELFKITGIKIDLLTSSTEKDKREQLLCQLRKGDIDLLIGTHSLLNEEIEFHNINLAVMDEQHRFGVAQRTALIEKNPECQVLTLTATPIPRSLQLVAYGEMDYLTIDKRHKNNVETYVVPREKRQEMFRFISEQCQKGKKAAVISPRIEDSEGIEISSVKELYKELSKTFFKKEKIAFLHGKLKEKEKNTIITDFEKGICSLLIATSVIEVGIDIADLSMIIVMNAERFGLATLHQLRGRVGRNGQKAFCFLYTEKKEVQRLNMLKECNNGLEIAEYDYATRGAGNIFGTEQSGQSEFSFVNNKNLELAKKIVANIDLQKVSVYLQGEIKRNRLKDVSLT